MTRRILLLLVSAATAAFAQTTPASKQETENVAAFARLYGVVRYFYPGDAAAALDWNRFAVYGVSKVRAKSAAALEATLEELFTTLGPGIEIAPKLSVRQQGGAPDASLVAWRYRGAGLTTSPGPYSMKRTNRAAPPSEPFEIPVTGAFVDVALTPRLKARVRLALSDAEARGKSPSMSEGNDAADLRLADVVVAWNVFRHFYPYWPETQVDWDARLVPQLDVALRAEGSREAHRNALRALVADARDGHGWVRDAISRDRPAALPVQLRVIEGKLVVIASSAPEARVGSVVTKIDGVSAADRVAKAIRLASGAAAWRPWRAVQELRSCPLGAVVKLMLEHPLEPTREAALTCSATRPPTEPRPDSIAQLMPDIWYLDITRVQMAQIQPILQTLAKAKGVVFDLRGYPTNAGAQILPYLLDVPEDDRWMHVAKIAAPFGQVSAWNSIGWNVVPTEPRFSGKRVFLTDGRAISYAESVMGYVRDHKLATIIGGTTAGTTGNVAAFRVPGGFEIVFTGMRVTRHDGRRPFHLAGVEPDIPIEPTLLALRAGRDELLERALAVIRWPR